MPATISLDLAERVAASLIASLGSAARGRNPFDHLILSRVLPPPVLEALRNLPFRPPHLDGVSGKRELHNDQRRYFDADTNAEFPACAAVAGAFQSPAVVSAVQAACGADLAGTCVRIEYAQDVDGFWLQPHTDLGVKAFTLLLYVNDRDDQDDLGTDLYRDGRDWAARTAFADNTALVFRP
ncbi:MAG: hypothetical protein JOZ27_03785, partial [Caulobacteraceae bacterium]|nr:hypothetical protein [Caulobacteraceae bacterium]